MIASLVGQLGGKIADIVDQSVADKDLATRMKAELAVRLAELDAEALRSRSAVIMSESSGQSWLQRNWRPLTMLVFVGLVVARWLGYSAPGISEQVELKLLSIIQFGLGGYVIGRSAEKFAALWGAEKDGKGNGGRLSL